MKNRLRLIWAALTAPQVMVDLHLCKILKLAEYPYIKSLEMRLDKLKIGTWDLIGVSIAYSDDKLNTTEIQRFLGSSPHIIRKLIEIIKAQV